MDFLKKLFSPTKESPSDAFQFGRYSDSFKTPQKLKVWDQCYALFYTDKKYIDAFEKFLDYLNDDAVKNVFFERAGDTIAFHLFQGSKRVSGRIDPQMVTCKSHIAKFDKLSVPVMRRLLEINHVLRYSRFAIEGDEILIRFAARSENCNLYKLYDAMKEVATNADKQDDMLSDEFKTITVIQNGSGVELPEAEREAKYKYIVNSINTVLERIKNLGNYNQSGGISYLLLDLAYRIDYLVVPQGPVQTGLEKIQNLYFAKDNKSYPEKNQAMTAEFEKILARPRESVLKEIYKVKSTFGIVTPSQFTPVISDLINNECRNLASYREPDIQQAIIGYVAGYTLFNYGLPKPALELFHLLMHVLNNDYFTGLGIPAVYYQSSKFSEGAIRREIDKIINAGRHRYPYLFFNTAALSFKSVADFGSSYLFEMSRLNFNEKR